jgi:excisionase family DNA binding protein
MQSSPDHRHRLALSVDEAAGAIGICSRSLRTLISKGDLRAARVGRRVLVTVETLQAYLREREADGDSI